MLNTKWYSLRGTESLEECHKQKGHLPPPNTIVAFPWSSATYKTPDLLEEDFFRLWPCLCLKPPLLQPVASLEWVPPPHSDASGFSSLWSHIMPFHPWQWLADHFMPLSCLIVDSEVSILTKCNKSWTWTVNIVPVCPFTVLSISTKKISKFHSMTVGLTGLPTSLLGSALHWLRDFCFASFVDPAVLVLLLPWAHSIISRINISDISLPERKCCYICLLLL